MDGLGLRLRTRLVPALLAALGVALLTTGLLSYSAPVEAGPETAQPPTVITLPPTATASPGPGGSGGASGSPTDSPPLDRLATRVVIPDLGIDLPIILQPSDIAYPLCDVAMYIEGLGQPGFGGATYLYAHARPGMFLPILTASKIRNGAQMLGMIVQVYTSDAQLFTYQITEVRRHQLNLDDAAAATTEQVWLQTSEGPKGTRPKTQVVAQFVSAGPADPLAAHPDAHPRECR